MIKGADVRVEFDTHELKRTIQKSGTKPLTRAGAYIRKSARNAVSRSKHSSAPGKPPHTRRGLLKRSILFGVEKERMTVVIGPAESFIGISMTAHVSVIRMSIQKVKLLGISFLGMVLTFSLAYFVFSLLVYVSQGDRFHISYRFP